MRIHLSAPPRKVAYSTSHNLNITIRPNPNRIQICLSIEGSTSISKKDILRKSHVCVTQIRIHGTAPLIRTSIRSIEHVTGHLTILRSREGQHNIHLVEHVTGHLTILRLREDQHNNILLIKHVIGGNPISPNSINLVVDDPHKGRTITLQYSLNRTHHRWRSHQS